MKKKSIAILLLLIICSAAVIIYLKKNHSREGVLRESGNVEVTETNLGFTMAGQIVSLKAEEGAKVTQGELIATLDDRELKAIVDQRKAMVAAAEADDIKARKDYERIESLFKQDVVSGQQLDAARRTRDASRSLVRQAEAALAAAKERLRDTILYAPISSVVLRKNSELGETVPAGAAVYTLGDLTRPWIKVYVRESDLGVVKYGQKVRVTVDSYPGKVYNGTVTYIASEAEFTPKNVQTKEERVKLVFGVKVSVENLNGELKPGMPADVEILLK